MKSHAILRTNVGLTTNVKLMVGNTYGLYLDSIVSTPELSDSKYKKMQFNKNNYWDELVPYFFKNTPADIAYGIKYDNDNDNMATDFAKQYDDLYHYGARNIVDNKDYSEEYEYFAPLYISKSKLPTNFVIFRVDGPGLTTINKSNFNTEIVNRLKCVKVFDLTRKSELGEWLETNITKNKSFPITPFYMDFRKLEFSSWFGMDFEDGGYSEKAFMLDSTLMYENTYHDFEKLIFDGFKKNKVIYPHIINLSFLFDDTPATPTSIRKWSLNRYLGFYLDDLELVKSVSPYFLPKVKSDVVIDQYNILYSVSSTDPFVETWKQEEYPYIEIGGNFYKINKYFEQQPSQLQITQISSNSYADVPSQPVVTKYKIISNINLVGRESEINKNIINITSSNELNRLSYYDYTTFAIDGFADSDVWMMNIDGVYHNIIKKDDGEFYLESDYAFVQSLEKFEYYVNDSDPNYRKSISLKVDGENAPKKFGIYRCKFSDIKDFDTDIIETNFSKHEYIRKNQLSITDETKMYTINHESTSFPNDFNDYKINGNVTNIPAASEYTANGETFRLVDDNLSTLWRKNSERVKWGFQNSISSNDYPYLLNNSFSAEDYNRTANVHDPKPHRHERNLDYFLTINPSSNDYLHHSLHVVDDEVITFYDNGFLAGSLVCFTGISNISAFSIGDLIVIDQYPGYINASYNTTASVTGTFFDSNGSPCVSTDIQFVQKPNGTPANGGTIRNLTRNTFSLDRYLGIGYDLDYFSYFFGKKTHFDSGNETVNTKKWSYFNSGDNSIPNLTLFRGLKFKLYDVDGVKLTDGKIDTVNIKTSNKYDGYKFSILLSKNNFVVNSSSDNLNIATVSNVQNSMMWKLVDDWKLDKIYEKDSIVRWSDILYVASTQSQIVDPNKYPSSSSDWTLSTDSSIFWSPNMGGTANDANSNNMFTFSAPPLVYNSGEFYYSSATPGNNFWDPSITYSSDSVVLYKNKVWKSTNSTNSIPGTNTDWILSPSDITIWSVVELWKFDKDYSGTNWNTSIWSNGYYVVYNDVIYLTISTTTVVGVAPDLDSNNWTKVYSFIPDTTVAYGSLNAMLANNNIIEMNNRLYKCVYNSNSNPSTLDNGINIYINKKYQNVLVNIYVNDNTYANSYYDYDKVKYLISKDVLSNSDRDDLYSDIYSKLTAHNFMNAINDLSNKYGFSDNIRYVIINEDSTINIYDFNNFNSIGGLPVLMTCEGPDDFLTTIKSNNVVPVSLEVSQIKPKRKLDSGNITSIDQLNYFSDIHLATKISKRTDDPIKVPNYHGLKNNTYHLMYRHSGYYAPIFHDIELFRMPSLTHSYGNYKFDTSLTYFGTIKERIVSKVNRHKNILKLKNNPNIKSTYPMLDEYGYHPTDFFVFKSNWDFEYHIECVESPQLSPVVANQSLVYNIVDNGSNNNNLSQL